MYIENIWDTIVDQYAIYVLCKSANQVLTKWLRTIHSLDEESISINIR